VSRHRWIDRDAARNSLGFDQAPGGNILAHTTITLGIGATVNGRLLAQTGAVTMNGNNTAGGAPVITNSPLTAAGTVGTSRTSGRACPV